MLPLPWVDKIFETMLLTYGDGFTRRYEGIDMDALRENWAKELAVFKPIPDAIAYGLENMQGGRPPDVREFKAMCIRWTPPPVPRLDTPAANPEIVRQQLAKLREPRLDLNDAAPGKPNLSWARAIVDRAGRGQHVRSAALRMAKAALAKSGGEAQA